MLEVVDLGAPYMEPACGCAALRGDRDGFFSAQILSGDRFRNRHDLLGRSAGDDLSAVGAGAGTYVHDIVSGTHGILVVFDHDHGVPQVAQIFEGVQKFVIVPLVQADAGFVQDIAHADQAGTDLGSQADPLGLSAGEGRGRAGQSQIVQADIIEEADAGADLLENLLSDHFLCLCELQILHEGLQFFYRHACQIINIDISHGDRQRLLFQALSAAGLAGRDLHEGLVLRSGTLGGRLSVAAAGVFQNALEDNRVDSLAALSLVVDVHAAVGPVHEHMTDIFGQLPPGGRHVKAVLLAQGYQNGIGKASLVHAGLPAKDGDGTAVDREAVVRHQQAGIKFHAVAQTCAVGAGAKWIVEGKAAGFDLLYTDPAVGAGKALAELQKLTAHNVCLSQSVGESEGVLQRIRHAALSAGADDQTVNHDLYIVLDIFVQRNVLGDIIHISVDAQADVTGPPGPVDDLFMPALAPADDRSQQLDPGALRQFHQAVHHLVNCLFGDLTSAVGTVWGTDSGVEEPEIVVDLRHCTHRGTGVSVGGFLVDGDGGREPLNVLDIRLLHLAQELARVRGQRLHIAPLPFRIDRIECQ